MSIFACIIVFSMWLVSAQSGIPSDPWVRSVYTVAAVIRHGPGAVASLRARSDEAANVLASALKDVALAKHPCPDRDGKQQDGFAPLIIGGRESGSYEGAWPVCVDELPTSGSSSGNQSCIVYSFGINDEWSFDDGMAELFGCQVFAFDPSMKQSDHLRSPSIRFIRAGLGGTNTNRGGPDGSWTLRTLDAWMSMLRHDHVDYLKIDIEGSEWHLLQRLMARSDSLVHVRQLGIEVHFWEDATLKTRGQLISVERAQTYASILNDMLHLHGWVPFSMHQNDVASTLAHPVVMRDEGPTCCYELGLLNSRYIVRNMTAAMPSPPPPPP